MPRQISSPDRLLDAALVCIGRVGLAKTTFDDVAREAGCARATVYRSFPGKQQLLAALVAREAAALGVRVVTAAGTTETLADAVVAVMTEGAAALVSHEALAFVCAHEPDLLLPYLAFESEDAVLRAAGALVAPAFTRFLPYPRAERLAEWVARMTLSYLCSPSETFDVNDPAQVRSLIEDFVLPGVVRSDFVEGVTQ